MYTATLKVLGKTYEAKGDTALAAIASLTPGNVKGKSILTLATGEQTKERILMPVVTYRLFNSAGFTREVALKNASLLFGL